MQFGSWEFTLQPVYKTNTLWIMGEYSQTILQLGRSKHSVRFEYAISPWGSCVECLHGVILGGCINGKVRPSWRKCVTGVGVFPRGYLVLVLSWSSASCPPLDESGPLPCAIQTFCPICRAVSRRLGPSETRSLQWSLLGLVTVARKLTNTHLPVPRVSVTRTLSFAITVLKNLLLQTWLSVFTLCL